VTVSGNFVGR